MLTTPDDPSVSLKELKYRHPRNSSVLHGHFRLLDDHVIVVLKRQTDKTSNNINKNRSKKRRDATLWSEPSEQTFHVVSCLLSSSVMSSILLGSTEKKDFNGDLVFCRNYRLLLLALISIHNFYGNAIL